MTVDEYDDNNYLYADFYHDGIDTVAIRNSRFASYYGSGTGISLERFLDPSPPSRNLLGKYPFNPLINVDALRLWYDLYKNANNGGNREFLYSLAGKLTNYNVTERVSSAYLMNTLNIGQFATVLAGVRVEKEDNDYIAEYCTGSLGTVGIAITASRPVLDSIAHFTQTHLLPNIQLTLKPTSFLNVRLAAYKAIARPGYNMRLAQFFDSSASGQMAITSGNTRLKNMEAWNYEANAQFFGDNFGLISISGFYKRITNFFHRTNSLNLDNGDFSRLCKQFDIVYTDSAIIQTIYGGNGIRASVAYNDPDPSYFWGLEFEHQMNFGFLPGYFKNITLSYNISLTRSLVHVIYGTTEVTLRKDSTRSGLPGHFIYTYSYTPVYHRTYRVQENNTEGQPELYGNAALGYDIGGFSVRLSCFYQDAYVRSYSALDQANIHVDPFFKVDLSLKQQITNSISIFLNINNLNNQSETTTTRNAYTGLGIQSWLNPNTEELYGRTIDLGVRLSL